MAAESYEKASGMGTAQSQSVAAPVDRKRKWTVMVFMGADTIKGNEPLREAAKADLEEMAAVGSGDALNVFVQVHGMGEVPQRGRIRAGAFPLTDVPQEERETAGGHALECFIARSLEEANHRIPDDHSMLVLWGHAYDFAIGRERTRTGTIDALDFAELPDVLKRLQHRFGSKDAKLDILGFDACDLATVEMACQLQPFANYLLGSQIGIPIPGWPDHCILDRLRNPQGVLMFPVELGSYTVRRFCESYPAENPVSLTLLDLVRAPELFARAEVLASQLARAIEDRDTLEWLAQLFLRSQTDEDRPYVDVADLCLTLARETGDAFIVEAARALGDFLIGPRPPLVGKSAAGTGRPFVAEHGRNAGHTARLNGISIYAPHVAALDFEAARPMYQNFAFARDTRWSELRTCIRKADVAGRSTQQEG